MEIPQCLVGRYAIDPATGCWNWISHRDGRPDGYGRTWVKIDGKWCTKAPHRLMLIAATGVEHKLDACHKCDNRGCINPDHLFWGTRQENYWDSRRKGRQPNVNKTHCKRGHELSGENLRIVQLKVGIERRCRECNRLRDRMYSRGESLRG